MDQVEEIKGKTDIVELIQEYVPLKRAGRNYKGLCPFHGEKTPSFMVNPELQIFKCFGCGEGGDAYSFLQRIEGMEFGEALRNLADRVGVKLVSYRPSQQEELKDTLLQTNYLAGEYYHYVLTKHNLGIQAREYLKDRGVTNEAIEIFKLGFAPEGWDFLLSYLSGKKGFKEEDIERAGLAIKSQSDRETKKQSYYDRFRNRIMFPLNNPRGQTVGFSGRVMPGADEKAGGKYVNTPETEIYHKSGILYGYDLARSAIKAENTSVLVEGQMDVIGSWQAGVPNSVGVGGTALTDRQIELLKRVGETVIMALDADQAGDAAARKGIEAAGKTGLIVKVVDIRKGRKYKDPGEWATDDPDGWKEAVKKAVVVYDFYLDSAVSRHGLDVVGKTRIGRELLPIWKNIEDEIVKAHYVKKLAEVLGVEEEDIRQQMAKSQVPKLNSQIPKNNQMTNERMKKSRREVVEEYIVGLALRGSKANLLATKPMNQMIKTDFWKKVIDQVAGFKPQTPIRELIKQMPAELRGRVEELMLNEEEPAGDEWEKEWKEAAGELETIGIREQITGYKHQEGKMKEVAKLAKRLSELTGGK
ncbi:DNA primase [Candidatus Amesbacteria bacterium RIFCSPHIGHO2_01_FULL_47_34]|uniref:DNA primase n=2 Tax=Candidatus Amesiibacteriota TaxID=1752730 RepID=A0A1F4Z898_9BACT|nr:MAG: DNA primase [Candidatus Amesbacteria bacterium RIFCSPHIGHO2_01_FULL_47_34]OGD01664.1 MAG: DNA primase [Candidatus Amesbacteria bacterium RIFCSPLOWO2_01_FULL_47_33]